MTSKDDQAYIEKVKRGDLASYTYLVDKYKNMAFTIAMRILSDSFEAEDVAQESFIKAYLQIGSFQGKSKFSTWLYTIVYRTAVSKLQQGKFKFASLDDEIGEEYAYDYSSNAIEKLQTAEREKFVKEAIQRLPKAESVVITLFYLSENSVEEISEITGLSASNVKVKLFRARKILEKELHFLL
ncbi:RNA polymerase sigma factor [Dyadobacter sp. CY323]|uniref:RNA polymerase sigma factor n=1 Tax=Dyadobacter sp. CY323 TaxID=2907302 RepID=UPI001F1D4BB0|nr:sigma-70 family RNA polymerase sigma factor [Dyadobacter sp. CY323]MCE6992435.1 sigma-70 family RNA polymerase sigma factor [Dyadobacter sp. CY323]